MKLTLLLFTLLLFSCTNVKQESSTETNAPATTEPTVIAEKKPIETKKIDEEPLVADTGQTWYKVSVTKNDTPYIKYEGTWPVLLTTEGFATLAFTAAKGALVISHGVTFYIYGWPPAIDRTPIIHSASKKGETSMIMVPVENGAYSLAISADSGFFELTKNENDGKVISGFFEAHATNANKDSFQFKGQFLNVKPH
jgi:hypothetical protein